MSDVRLDSGDNQTARVFVANISPNLDPDDLQERFSKYGAITGVVVLKGFGFVQFENEEDALNAIKAENGSDFNGRRLDVKVAKRKEELQSEKASQPQQEQASTKQQQQHDFEPQRNQRGAGFGRNAGFGDGGSGFGGGGRGFGAAAARSGGPTRGGGGRGGARGAPYENQQRFNQQQNRQKAIGGNDYGNENDYDDFYYGNKDGQFNDPQLAVEEMPNDCEIVCVHKGTRQYAEMIEARLKNFGLRVDVLFPNPDIPLLKIIENIASRGVFYAILVTPLNEQHRSLTLNVLQGQPQEHRNMPLEDAMGFIAKTFEAAMDGKLQEVGSGGLPNDIRTVLGFVADSRPLSVMEYDKLIRYFCMKREGVLRSEYGENIPPSLATPPVGPPVDPSIKAKQDELHERIISILNRPAGYRDNNALSGGGSAAAKPGGELNASLQRAIDSLIKTGPNLLSQMHTNQTSGNSGYGMYNY